MRSTFIAILLAGSISGTAAVAQTDMSPPPPPHADRGMGGMMAADADHDGVVTRAEAIAAADRRFDAIDTDHDGRISATEMAAYRDAMMARRGGDMPVPPPGGGRHDPGMGRRADPNGDHVVNREEYRARALARFDRMDVNHDGRIDRTEMANMREMRDVEHREHADDRTPSPPPPPPPPPAQS